MLNLGSSWRRASLDISNERDCKVPMFSALRSKAYLKTMEFIFLLEEKFPPGSSTHSSRMLFGVEGGNSPVSVRVTSFQGRAGHGTHSIFVGGGKSLLQASDFGKRSQFIEISARKKLSSIEFKILLRFCLLLV
ncbi:hypothetical protein CIRG_09916 [Coccidioides immitis RMSCC 2394]|uniref:Uncharacterized protein n=1 Tax=Coccidioides immitis RMSCC 2394 TaxID=404692 RepID=A0A0J6YR04_COCIT|nr:hypothetical protein CIRG_09916 [Coccidioides immitis RMSCC 2394]